MPDATGELGATAASELPPPTDGGVNGHDVGGDSVGRAAERVIDAARSLLLDHLGLALLEVRTLASSALRAGALAIVGALFLAAAWGLAMATLYHFVGDGVPPWQRLAGITVGTAIVGLVLVTAAVREMRA